MLILLDRDGVINEDRAHFVKSPDELVFISGALQAICRLKKYGHILAIVTNQSCIGRGIITPDTLHSIHEKLLGNIREMGSDIDHIFIAPDAPWEATENRKPGSGMMKAAMSMFAETPANTVLIGDSKSDLQAAMAAGCHRILVRSGKGAKTQADGIPRDLLPVSVAKDLAEATEFILTGRFS